jgi:hypothetical protein
MFVDLAAEQIVAAEKGGRQIAVEVKGFGSLSKVHDLEQAVGQYLMYRSVLTRREPQRSLYLPVTETAFIDVFDSDLGQLLREDYAIHLVLFDPHTEVIVRWTDSTSSGRSSVPS